MEIFLATSSSFKFSEAKEVISFPIQQISIDIPEIQSMSVDEVAQHKVVYAFQQIGERTLVEDTGLYINAWNGLPGALISWFIKSVGVDGICRMMSNESDRKAVAKTTVAYYDGTDMRLFSGEIHGVIPYSPSGSSGFGWDAIFQPRGYCKTFAEMLTSGKNSISMRRIAFLKLNDFFTKNNR